MRTTLAFICAVLVGACAGGDGNGSGDDAPPDAPAAQAVCGDGTCAASEVGHCPADCGGQVTPVCGNSACEAPSETTANCPSDCPATGPVCGDAVCDAAGGETSANCPGDCTGGSTIDCADQNVVLLCVACFLDPTACVAPVTVEACTACVGGP
ncbi:MAG: hypothetical protein H6Q90_1085 [Deltaproteobacteria bacterium]|nr:hypothetical protein [Deltaproteobacteria bacterium]